MFEILGIVVVCVIVADFITGFAHWLEDTYCLDELPLIGGLICTPNIDHHLDPQLLVRDGTFVSRNLVSVCLSAGGFLVAWLCGFGYWPVALTLFVTSFGNEIHRWNHTDDLGWFATFMKDAGLVQARSQHSIHHKPPFTSHYCIITSFTNAVLERIQFWRRLEWVILKVFRLRPKREDRRDWNMGK